MDAPTPETKLVPPLARPATGQAGVVPVLAGGILLQAITAYLTSALMPSVVADIGGQAYYAWVTTVFILASVAATMAVPSVLGRLGSRLAYLVAAAAFGLGSAAGASAPTMQVLLIGRVAQGVGGGLLSGLAFALIRSSLPKPAWGRGTAIISAMFAVGTVVGPAIGGAFAQLGAWRAAFGLLAVVALALGIGATAILPRSPRSPASARLPLLSLLLLTAAVGALSTASVVPGAWVWVALVAGGVLIAIFVIADRSARDGVLPAITYHAGPFKWLYIALASTTAATASEAFTPLFGQRLFGLVPFAAGFLGATVSAGWSAAALMSARATDPLSRTRLTLAGPAVTASAMAALVALQLAPATAWTLAGWVVALVVAGAGIGLSNPHLSVRVMSSSADAADGARAASAIPVASQIGQAVIAAVGGTVVHLALPSLHHAATGLFAVIGVAAVLGIGAVGASLRPEPSAPGGTED